MAVPSGRPEFSTVLRGVGFSFYRPTSKGREKHPGEEVVLNVQISDFYFAMSDSFTSTCQLLLTDEAPFVDVIAPYLSSTKTGRSGNKVFTLYTIQSCYLRFSHRFRL